MGSIGHEEVLRRTAEADLLFVFRSHRVLANKYICGSKLLEAMMCGRPILVNKGTSTANKVLEENCGLVVDANNIEDIKEAIITLRDNPELCEELMGIGEDKEMNKNKRSNGRKNIERIFRNVEGVSR